MMGKGCPYEQREGYGRVPPKTTNIGYLKRLGLGVARSLNILLCFSLTCNEGYRLQFNYEKSI